MVWLSLHIISIWAFLYVLHVLDSKLGKEGNLGFLEGSFNKKSKPSEKFLKQVWRVQQQEDIFHLSLKKIHRSVIRTSE